MNPKPSAELPDKRKILGICLLLAVAIGFVYWQVRHFESVMVDDPLLIFFNPFVTAGVTLNGFIWSLTTSYYEYWHPATWWSHMLDFQLFGTNAGRHHLTNVAIHTANAIILFLALRQMTGRLWRSAVVAGLFALHPMHVESVAWLAERKDVLSAFFWLLSVWAYGSYVQFSDANRAKAGNLFRASVLLFLLGLMSKPMVVTLPFVLLLLDYWPLNRYEAVLSAPAAERLRRVLTIFGGLLKEKVAYFGLMAGSCAITFFGVKAGNNVVADNEISWGMRLGNLPVAYARYLGKAIWPANMSAFYPLPNHWPIWQVSVAIAILVFISALAIKYLKSSPFIAVGWCIFLGVLVPTMSLVPVGLQSIADRYTYLPYIGIFIAVVWGAAEFFDRIKAGGVVPAGAAVIVLLACCLVARVQAGYWRNNFTLWPHCLAVTTNNFMAHYDLAFCQQMGGQLTNAIENYEAAVRIKPNSLQANLNLGRTLVIAGRFSEATNYLAKALQVQPANADAHRNLGMAFVGTGDFAGAIAELDESIRLDPRDFRTHLWLGRAYSGQKKSDDALRCYLDAMQLAPANAEVRYYYGMEQLKRGQVDDAVVSFGEALKINPAFADAREQLDTALKKKAGK